MEDFKYIQQKLSAFIRRYYKNELLKGSILFFSIWLLYFIIILLIENFFWLSSLGRGILFWTFIAVSFGLLFKFIFIPFAKLFRLSQGLDPLEASKVIGKHFPEVNDKLVNVLQLQNSGEKSDLLLAGIAQKSRELKPVPFNLAINFRSSLKYLKYAAFPVILGLVFLVTGNSTIFSESYARVVNYNTAYEPPAPFSFVLAKENIQVEEGQDFKLLVETVGKIVPEEVSIRYQGEEYLLKSSGGNKFEYQFRRLKDALIFKLSANGIESRPYAIEVVKVPKLVDFEMELNYPGYTGKSSEIIKGTGNITVPEGTKVSWKLKTKATENVDFVLEDSIIPFKKNAEEFLLNSTVYSNFDYQITTSNSSVKDYETLEYAADVIRDQFPQIKVEHKIDSIVGEIMYFSGSTSDDYAVSSVNMIYYVDDQEEKALKVPVSSSVGNFTEFITVFPGELKLEQGTNYSVYFEVYDNDGVRGPKRSKSETFSFRKKSGKEIKEEQLQMQGESIENLSRSLEKMELSEQELKELSQLQKQKENLDYNNRKKLESFLERQQQQTEMMKKYSDKLEKSLEEKGNNEENSQFKEELKERLERNEERLEQNEKLLEELQKYSEKISREELTEKLEQLSKQNTSEQKNLEQLLELTKRYYVQEKTQKLAGDLEEMAQKQEELSQKDSLNTPEEQKKVSESFEKFEKDMDELQKENENLKKPMDLEREKPSEEEVKEEQQKAEENLEQQKKTQAKQNQKKAADKMKEMSKKLKSQMMMSQGEQMNANIESMRQILDNLLVFSFEQEALLLKFRDIRINDPGYAAQLRKQQVLKDHFKHIDDSIFSLALSNPMITEKITSKLTNIQFNIDKSLERLAQNEVPQGTASQQYVMTDTNELALMLDDVLENMQEMVNPSSGSGNGQGSPAGGKGNGKQLQDIIQSQEQLSEQMKEGMEEGAGKGKKQGEGEDGGEGEGKGKEEGKDGTEKSDEEMSGKLFGIYKEQQRLRRQLENKLQESGLDKKHAALLEEMKRVENDVLNKGFDSETIKRMNQITHKLLELESSVIEQEEEERRTSNFNEKEFQNSAKDQLLKAKEYFNSTEILNRQALPLRPVYKNKVKKYFEGVED